MIEADIPDLSGVGDARALIEAELAELVSDETVDDIGVLLDELAARACKAWLLPLHVTVRRYSGRVRVDVGFQCPPTTVADLLDRLPTDDVPAGALSLINQLSELSGLTVDGHHGRLWCEVSALP